MKPATAVALNTDLKIHFNLVQHPIVLAGFGRPTLKKWNRPSKDARSNLQKKIGVFLACSPRFVRLGGGHL